MTQAAGALRARSLGARLSRLRPEAAVVGAVVTVIGVLTLVPLGYLVWQAFLPDGELTLDRFRDAYGAYGLDTMLANSLWFGAGSTGLAMGLGTVLAYLVVRTDLPGRRLLFAASVAPLALPGVLYTVAWIFLASPRSGAVNVLLEPLLGPATFDVFSMWGMVFVEGLHLAPVVFLLMAAAFRSMDPSFEESARVAGARLPQTFRRVTLPLARPALAAAALIVAVRSLEAFEVPALLGTPAGIWVFTSRIWRSLGEYPPDLGEAAAYSMPLLVLTLAGLFLYTRLARGRRFETVTGRGFRPRQVPLGPWRWPAAAFAALYSLIAAVLPLLVLVYVSTQRFYTAPTRESLSSMTLDSYVGVLGDDRVLGALENSALLGVGAATAVVLLTAVAAWLVVRARVPGRWLVDSLAFLPLAVPGLVVGVAVLVVTLRSELPIYGTLWILLVAYLIRFLPYGMRHSSAAMAQIGQELEESAHASGAGWWQTFRRVLFPLLLPGLAAGWLYVLIVAVRELSSSILLYSPGNEVLSVEIWERYQNGQFPELAALGVLMVVGLAGLALVARTLGSRLGLGEV